MAVYASTDEIRNYTRVSSAEFSDEALDDMIAAATAKIDRLTGRTWQGTQTVTNKYYTGDGTQRIYLDNTDIIAISALSINIAPTGTTFNTVTPARCRIYTDLGMIQLQPDAEINYFPAYYNSTLITYTYGNQTPPEDIKLACRYYVAYMMKVQPEIDKDFFDIIDNYKLNAFRVVP